MSDLMSGQIPRTPSGIADMAAISRAVAGHPWLEPLVKAAYDAGHSDGESCREQDVRIVVENAATWDEVLAEFREWTGDDLELGSQRR